MKRYLLTTALAAVMFTPLVAHSAEILAFGQSTTTNDVTLVATGGTSTTLTATDVPVGITAMLGGSPVSAFLDLTAHSIGAATPLGAGFQQNFAGSFSLTSLAGGSGINFLSGVFSDLAVGLNTILLIGSSDPPDAITLTSDVISVANLGLPLGIAFSLSNVNPPVGRDGNTLASGTAALTGTFDAEPVAEPATLAVLGVGIAGLGFVRNRQRRNDVVGAAA